MESHHDAMNYNIYHHEMERGRENERRENHDGQFMFFCRRRKNRGGKKDETNQGEKVSQFFSTST